MWTLLEKLTGGVGVPSIESTFKVLFANIVPIFYHLSWSTFRLFGALSLALIIGSSLGYMMAHSPNLDQMFSPLLYILTPIPKVAFLPIFMVIFGINDFSRILILMFVIIFQFIIGMRGAIKSIPANLKLSIDALNTSKKFYILKIILPYSLPTILNTLRQSFGMSLAVLFFLETFVNQVGIGYYIMNRWGMVNYPEMFAGIVSLSVYGVLVYAFIDWLETRLCPWNS